jgi:hypothetical protein
MSFFNHFGYDRNTGAELIVVFRTLPQERGSCLVVQTDSLDPHMRDKLVATAKSASGQKDFYEVLHANLMNNNLTYLQYLHQNRLLVKRKVTDVLIKDRFNNMVNVAEYEQGLLQAVNNQRLSQAQAQAARLIREAEGYENLARERRARASEIIANASKISPEMTTAEAIRQALAAEQAAAQQAAQAEQEPSKEVEVFEIGRAEVVEERANVSTLDANEEKQVSLTKEAEPLVVESSSPPKEVPTQTTRRSGRPRTRKS